MNRLWVRLSLMMSTVLFLVFFIQFLSIMLEPQPDLQEVQESQVIEREDAAHHQEITNRLFIWMAFSVTVGLAGGVVISQVISSPVRKLVAAAHRLGQGERQIRVPETGSQELVELAQTFNKMAADLEDAERLRNNLMADVSHELRTPLTVLEGNLRAALDHVYTLDEAEIANLLSQTHHLIRLVNDLRELALAETRQLPLQMQPVDINDLVEGVLQALEPLAGEKEVSLSLETPSLPELTADPARLRQVLFNLLANSLRHTSTGGKIVMLGKFDAKNIILQIKDDGDGLDRDQLRAVFDRFYRGDKSRSRETGGSGLGLAIVKAIVEAHGGQVEVESPGKGLGCTFTVTLPRV